MKYRLFYIFLYFNADSIFNKLYLSNYSALLNNELIIANQNFYYSITNLDLFAVFILSIYVIKNYLYYNPTNKNTIALAMIYIKYILNSLLSDNITVYQYESSRYIMWLFTTPLMLKMYCDVNRIHLRDINIQYHVIPAAINVFIYPYKHTAVYYYLSFISWMSVLYFMRSLFVKRELILTNIYLFIWGLFMCLTVVDMLQITNQYNMNLQYSFADMTSKIITCLIVNDYNEKELAQISNMDLQSLQFISYMINGINKYKKDHPSITARCEQFIEFTTHRFLARIPEDKTLLEQEMLKKILPFNLDKEYIANKTANNTAKQFNMICILFTDIVNYTELAKKYNDKIIFQLLYDVYDLFDNIIKKYSRLQKIETIGDAYMVVGDIFRNTVNHKIVVKEIVLFAMDILNEIKTIKTPDDVPLSIRIGINLGNVSIGILGNEIPRLCVVGNAVNMASRLQSTADVDTIQFSRHIHEQIREIEFDKKIHITKKENVFLKNIGSVTTYNIYSQGYGHSH